MRLATEAGHWEGNEPCARRHSFRQRLYGCDDCHRAYISSSSPLWIWADCASFPKGATEAGQCGLRETVVWLSLYRSSQTRLAFKAHPGARGNWARTVGATLPLPALRSRSALRHVPHMDPCCRLHTAAASRMVTERTLKRAANGPVWSSPFRRCRPQSREAHPETCRNLARAVVSTTPQRAAGTAHARLNRSETELVL